MIIVLDLQHWYEHKYILVSNYEESFEKDGITEKIDIDWKCNYYNKPTCRQIIKFPPSGGPTNNFKQVSITNIGEFDQISMDLTFDTIVLNIQRFGELDAKTA